MTFNWLRALLPLRDRNSEHATSVLAVTCSDRERSALDEIASKSKWRLCFASSSTAAETYLRGQPIAVILYDRDLPGTHWRDHMGNLLRSAPNSCVILVSGSERRVAVGRGDSERWVRCAHEAVAGISGRTGSYRGVVVVEAAALEETTPFRIAYSINSGTPWRFSFSDRLLR